MKYSLFIFFLFLFNDAVAQQSFDDRSILVVSSYKDSVSIFKVSNGKYQFVVNGDVPSISSDRKFIAYVVPGRGAENRSIHILNLKDNNSRKLADMNSCYPQWSPSGKAMLFESYNKGIPDIYIVNVDDGRKEKLLGNAKNPAWSQDGKKIAFIRDYDIYILELETGKVTQLTHTNTLEKFPAWSPDGGSIVFYSQYHDLNLTAMDIIYLSSGKRVTIMKGTFDHFSWTENGQILYEYRNPKLENTQIGVVDPVTKESSIITDNQHDCTWPVWVGE